MRGENVVGGFDSGVDCGSSPHARGKRPLQHPNGASNRLIPACAGKTKRNRAIFVRLPAHPRMRGENASAYIKSLLGDGSSPHARGKPGRGLRRLAVVRLIPACAGKTALPSLSALSIRAHPRMRGENGSMSVLMMGRVGSSPHARGKQAGAGELAADVRLIPACAGKTCNSDRTVM